MKEQILKMEKEIEQLKIENKEKEDALIELSQFYYVSKYFIYLLFIFQYYKNKNQSDSINEDNNEEAEN